jgi:hypothetical protein
MADDIMFSFDRLFPAIKPGGCYVIEDLQVHADTSTDLRIGTATTLPRDLVKDACQYLMDGSRDVAGKHGMARYLRQHIDRIEVVRKAVFIWKTDPENYDTDALEEVVRQTPTPKGWEAVAHMRHRNGDASGAAAALQESITLRPRQWHLYVRRAQLLEQAGDLRAALDAARDGVEVAPEHRRNEVQALAERLAKANVPFGSADGR